MDAERDPDRAQYIRDMYKGFLGEFGERLTPEQLAEIIRNQALQGRTTFSPQEVEEALGDVLPSREGGRATLQTSSPLEPEWKPRPPPNIPTIDNNILTPPEGKKRLTREQRRAVVLVRRRLGLTREDLEIYEREREIGKNSREASNQAELWRQRPIPSGLEPAIKTARNLLPLPDKIRRVGLSPSQEAKGGKKQFLKIALPLVCGLGTNKGRRDVLLRRIGEADFTKPEDLVLAGIPFLTDGARRAVVHLTEKGLKEASAGRALQEPEPEAFLEVGETAVRDLLPPGISLDYLIKREEIRRSVVRLGGQFLAEQLLLSTRNRLDSLAKEVADLGEDPEPVRMAIDSMIGCVLLTKAAGKKALLLLQPPQSQDEIQAQVEITGLTKEEIVRLKRESDGRRGAWPAILAARMENELRENLVGQEGWISNVVTQVLQGNVDHRALMVLEKRASVSGLLPRLKLIISLKNTEPVQPDKVVSALENLAQRLEIIDYRDLAGFDQLPSVLQEVLEKNPFRPAKVLAEREAVVSQEVERAQRQTGAREKVWQEAEGNVEGLLAIALEEDGERSETAKGLLRNLIQTGERPALDELIRTINYFNQAGRGGRLKTRRVRTPEGIRARMSTQGILGIVRPNRFYALRVEGEDVLAPATRTFGVCLGLSIPGSLARTLGPIPGLGGGIDVESVWKNCPSEVKDAIMSAWRAEFKNAPLSGLILTGRAKKEGMEGVEPDTCAPVGLTALLAAEILDETYLPQEALLFSLAIHQPGAREKLDRALETAAALIAGRREPNEIITYMSWVAQQAVDASQIDPSLGEVYTKYAARVLTDGLIMGARKGDQPDFSPHLGPTASRLIEQLVEKLPPQQALDLVSHLVERVEDENWRLGMTVGVRGAVKSTVAKAEPKEGVEEPLRKLTWKTGKLIAKIIGEMTAGERLTEKELDSLIKLIASLPSRRTRVLPKHLAFDSRTGEGLDPTSQMAAERLGLGSLEGLKGRKGYGSEVEEIGLNPREPLYREDAALVVVTTVLPPIVKYLETATGRVEEVSPQWAQGRQRMVRMNYGIGLAREEETRAVEAMARAEASQRTAIVVGEEQAVAEREYVALERFSVQLFRVVGDAGMRVNLGTAPQDPIKVELGGERAEALARLGQYLRAKVASEGMEPEEAERQYLKVLGALSSEANEAVRRLTVQALLAIQRMELKEES